MIALPSGLVISQPIECLSRFCSEEYAYYDGLPAGNPDQVEPIDVLAAVSVNGFFRANAAAVRSVHRGLANACDGLLPRIQIDAALQSADPPLAELDDLLRMAIGVRGVLTPLATKVLHRKHPNLIPMLDNVVLAYYFGGKLPPATQDKSRASGVAAEAIQKFRDDLGAVQGGIAELALELAATGYSLSPVRILEVLIWISVEERGYYR